MSYVYLIEYEAFGESMTDIVGGDDLYTALSKWRERVRVEQVDAELTVSGEPDKVTRWDWAEIIP